jgi:hypothetical protein
MDELPKTTPFGLRLKVMDLADRLSGWGQRRHNGRRCSGGAGREAYPIPKELRTDGLSGTLMGFIPKFDQ